jgi:hypothetical protein
MPGSLRCVRALERDTDRSPQRCGGGAVGRNLAAQALDKSAAECRHAPRRLTQRTRLQDIRLDRAEGLHDRRKRKNGRLCCANLGTRPP